MRPPFLISLLVVELLLTPALGADVVDAIYHGGDVVTIDEKNPTAEAVAVKNGKIVAVGKKAEVLKLRSDTTQLIDLGGRTMLPGFVDAHGHCFNVGFQAASANLLPPPDYTVKSIASLKAELKKWAATDVAKKYRFIVGFGYDDAQLREQRHPTRQDLDEVSRDLPVLAMHQSLHLGAMSTKALELAGITAKTKDPEGGVIRREADGKTPSGVLEEAAFHLAALRILPKLGEAELDALATAGLRSYAKHGFTFAQEGAATDGITQTWIRLARKQKLLIDVTSYSILLLSDQPLGLSTPWHSRSLKNGYKIGGVKLLLDGSPQGKTAYLSRPYYTPPHGKNATYRGYPSLSDEAVVKKVDLCYKKGWQFLAHCNGDAASDLMIGAVKEAQKKWGKDAKRRDVMVHCQTVREDQLDAMKDLGIIPSMFGMHCFYWGDWHRDSVLGAERAERISPARSAMRRGMIFTQHHDAPVALPSAIRILSSVVTRRTRSNDILGASQCIGVDAALKSITLWAAYQHYEEANRGSIQVGKLADFVLLDKNPLKVPITALAELKVMETIKEGKTVWKAGK
jgi:predicted amidohydrolase YtcJ